MRQRTLGILQVTFAGFCFGFLGVLGKWAYALGLSSGELLSLRFLGAATLLAPILFVRNRAALRLPWPAIYRALALGVFGYALFSSCFFAALRGLSVSLTVLLLYMYPVWVALGERFVFGEKLSRFQYGALVVLLAGLGLLLSGEIRVRDPWFLALGMASSVFYAIYILASRHWLKGVPPFGSGFYVMLGAGVVLGVLNLRALPSTGEAWLMVLAVAIVGTILPVSLFLAGLQNVRASEASMLSLVEPFTGVAVGAALLGERFGPVQGVGAAVILAGLVAIALPPRSPRRPSATSEGML